MAELPEILFGHEPQLEKQETGPHPMAEARPEEKKCSPADTQEQAWCMLLT